MPKNSSDLDALLGGGSGFSTIDPKILEEAQRIAATAMGGGAEALGVLTGRGVIYTEGGTEYHAPADALADFSGKATVSTVKWSGDRQGELNLVLPETAAKGIVAYMMAAMMGTPADPESTALDAEGMDALGEAINNFLGSASQALRNTVGGNISLVAVPPRLVDFDATPAAVEFGPSDRLCHSCQLTIEGMVPAEARLLMTVEVTGMNPEIKKSGQMHAVSQEEPEQEAGDLEKNRKLAMKMLVPVLVVLAEKQVRMEVIQSLAPGSIIEFRKLSGEMLDVCVGKVKVGEGEVVITNEHFGIQMRKMVDIRASMLGSN